MTRFVSAVLAIAMLACVASVSLAKNIGCFQVVYDPSASEGPKLAKFTTTSNFLRTDIKLKYAIPTYETTIRVKTRLKMWLEADWIYSDFGAPEEVDFEDTFWAINIYSDADSEMVSVVVVEFWVETSPDVWTHEGDYDGFNALFEGPPSTVELDPGFEPGTKIDIRGSESAVGVFAFRSAMPYGTIPAVTPYVKLYMYPFNESGYSDESQPLVEVCSVAVNRSAENVCHAYKWSLPLALQAERAQEQQTTVYAKIKYYYFGDWYTHKETIWNVTIIDSGD